MMAHPNDPGSPQVEKTYIKTSNMLKVGLMKRVVNSSPIVIYSAALTRPFNRRRFKTARPDLVVFLLRNPCFLFLFSFLGWYVRFGMCVTTVLVKDCLYKLCNVYFGLIRLSKIDVSSPKKLFHIASVTNGMNGCANLRHSIYIFSTVSRTCMLPDFISSFNSSM